jgi:acetylornithine deacetylase/succinyl-diaminopimelate desuccinylase-like protein
MRAGIDTAPAIAAVDERRILDLEQRSIRISSPTFQEGEIAELYAQAMADIGLDVEMMEILHPQDPAKKSRQPIGRLRGAGGGPTLLLNGHMDPGAEMSGWTVDPLGAKFEDGWSGEWARMTTRAAALPRSAPSRRLFAQASACAAMSSSRR